MGGGVIAAQLFLVGAGFDFLKAKNGRPPDKAINRADLVLSTPSALSQKYFCGCETGCLVALMPVAVRGGRT